MNLPSPTNIDFATKDLALQTPKIQNQWKDDFSRYIAIAINTDTMAPTLRAGDVAWVDCADIRLSEGLFGFSLPDGHLTKGYQTVKRVDRRSNNVVRLMHDNKSYCDIDINPNNPKDSFQVIGRVVWTVCRA